MSSAGGIGCSVRVFTRNAPAMRSLSRSRRRAYRTFALLMSFAFGLRQEPRTSSSFALQGTRLKNERQNCVFCTPSFVRPAFLAGGGIAYGAANDVVEKLVAIAAEVGVLWDGVFATFTQASCPAAAGSLAHPIDVEYILISV